MLHPSIRLVLARNVSLRQFQRVADEAGWRLERVMEQQGVYPAQWIWRATDGHTVGLVQDATYRWNYMFAQGPRRELLARYLSERLPHLSRADLLRMWDRDRYGPDAALATLALGVGAPDEEDDHFMARLALALAHGDPEVRLAAVRAIALTRWLVFHAALSDVAQHDRDERVAHLAEGVAEAMELANSPPRPS